MVEITLWGWGFGNHNPGGLGGSGDLSGWGGFCEFGDLGRNPIDFDKEFTWLR